MAGSRVHGAGTIYTRINGLLKSGAITAKEKPLWFDVYEAFPPRLPPNINRSVQETEVPQIVYKEDVIRAFVKLYLDIARRKTSRDAAETFFKTANIMKADGVRLTTKDEMKERRKRLPRLKKPDVSDFENELVDTLINEERYAKEDHATDKQ